LATGAVSRWLRHPAALALLAGLAVLAAAFVPALWMMLTTPPHPAAQRDPAAPWALEPVPGGGIRVFGLHLPGATLADAQSAWGDDLQLALMASRGEPAMLEASVETARPGTVGGRLVFSAEAKAQDIERWRGHAAKEEPVSADTRRIALRADDRADALRTPIVGIGFIPAAQLDARTLRERFGAPAEVWRSTASVEHWLYPDRGLDVMLDEQGRELLQYVAPADFERRLRAPLVRATASPASGPPG